MRQRHQGCGQRKRLTTTTHDLIHASFTVYCVHELKNCVQSDILCTIVALCAQYVLCTIVALCAI